MPNFADDTNVEVLEKETAQAPEDTPIQDEVVEDDAVVAEKPGEEVQEEEPPQPEGASPAMRELARQWLPEKFIEVARDDDQLKGMIDAAREANAAPPPQEEEPDFELKWPDDEDLEVPEVVRKKVTELNDHYTGQIKQLKKDMGSLVGIAKDMQQKQEAQVQQLQFEEQRGFDEELDNMDNDIVGKFGSMSEGQILIREALFKQAQAIKEKKGGSLRSHVPEVAKLVRAESKQQKQAYSAKVREQSNGRLGSGNCPRLPEPAKSKDKEFEEFLEKLGARHIK